MHRAAIVVILLLALGLRVGFALDPVEPQSPDSRGYARIAQSLYQDGEFEQRGDFAPGELQDSSNYSPGLPLFVAAIYELSGGVHPELARIVLALIGTLGVFLAYLLGRRLGGSVAGLVAALVVATYPALLEYQGMIMTEPLAATLLAASLLACFWASDRGAAMAWALPGLLLGLLAMVRPEYLLFGLALPLLAALRTRGPGRGRWAVAAGAAAIAFLLPVLPWTIRNAVVLDRLVPISTGSGKVLYIGTYLPAGGDGTELRQHLLERDPGLRRRFVGEVPRPPAARPDPWPLFSQQVPPAEGVDPGARLSRRLYPERVTYLERLLALVAARDHPGTPTDQALGRMGRDNIERYLGDDPLGFAGMLARKAADAWIEGPRATMLAPGWRVWHGLVVALALLGLGLLANRRRWEAIPIVLLALAATALSALLIASPRRVVVILPVVAALAGVAVAWIAQRLRGVPAAP